MKMLKLGLILLLAGYAAAIPIDNGVEGDPEIECGPNSITVNFNTQNNFEGHVYVKGLYDQPECRTTEGGRQVAGIELPFDSCNVARTRSLNPKGVFVTTTVVITFHPQFITKIDRAYRIQCFYMEADKTVSTEIEVSMITTGFQTQLVPMPVCRYEILEGGPTGQPVQFALVGDQVYHKWTCDTETVDTFCMIVHSCFVDDGNGDKVDLLDADGCAQDRFLLNNLEYPTDLMAGQEAHVFKYADRAQLFFQCQITITIKEPGAQCPRPQCAQPEGRGGRKRRQTIGWEQSNAGTLDVRAEVEALDIDDRMNALPVDLAHRALPAYAREPVLMSRNGGGFCMSTAGFMTFAAMTVALLAAVAVIATCMAMRRSEKA